MRNDFLYELVGSMSTGAAGNPTVAMMEAAFAHHHLPWRYVNMEVLPSDLGDAVAGARAMGFRGFNCSMPHKQSVIAHLDGLTRSAELSGAVNCVMRHDDGRLIGTNTDGMGFLRALREVRDPSGTNVVVLGAGGAARAVAVELALAAAAKITVVNRTLAAAQDLAAMISRSTATDGAATQLVDGYRVPEGTDIVVNATSVGLYDREAVASIDLNSIASEHVAADVVFNPADTALLRAARRAGARTVDGLGMLVHQGAEAVRLWTGIEPDLTLMHRTLRAAMGV